LCVLCDRAPCSTRIIRCDELGSGTNPFAGSRLFISATSNVPFSPFFLQRGMVMCEFYRRILGTSHPILSAALPTPGGWKETTGNSQKPFRNFRKPSRTSSELRSCKNTMFSQLRSSDEILESFRKFSGGFGNFPDTPGNFLEVFFQLPRRDGLPWGGQQGCHGPMVQCVSLRTRRNEAGRAFISSRLVWSHLVSSCPVGRSCPKSASRVVAPFLRRRLLDFLNIVYAHPKVIAGLGE